MVEVAAAPTVATMAQVLALVEEEAAALVLEEEAVAAAEALVLEEAAVAVALVEPRPAEGTSRLAAPSMILRQSAARPEPEAERRTP